MSQRTDRIGNVIRNELSTLIRRDLRDPRVSLASILEVEVSRDLHYAKVRVSVLGEDGQRDTVMEGLRHASSFLRRRLGQNLRLRVVPELEFILDRGAEYSRQITDLLEDLDIHDEDT